jgi:hypothetical protein
LATAAQICARARALAAAGGCVVVSGYPSAGGASGTRFTLADGQVVAADCAPARLP